jgi:hypothetical protein
MKENKIMSILKYCSKLEREMRNKWLCKIRKAKDFKINYVFRFSQKRN